MDFCYDEAIRTVERRAIDRSAHGLKMVFCPRSATLEREVDREVTLTSAVTGRTSTNHAQTPSSRDEPLRHLRTS
jgi:hypothetical protein